MTMFRQGDVLVVRVESKPETATKQEQCVLALGEVTGHAHQITEGATLYLDRDGTKFFEVDAPPHKGWFVATLLEENTHSFLIVSDLGTIRFSKQFAQFHDGRVQCEPFALLEHEEHHFHAYGKGTYRVILQREYTPEAIRNVAD